MVSRQQFRLRSPHFYSIIVGFPKNDNYKKYGKAGLCRKKNNYLSPEGKKRLIRLHEEKGVSLRSIYTAYDISPSVFKCLLIKVRAHGYSSLYEYMKRGRPPKVPSMARSKKKEPQTELEKLQAENLRLRAENALLKKVREKGLV